MIFSILPQIGDHISYGMAAVRSSQTTLNVTLANEEEVEMEEMFSQIEEEKNKISKAKRFLFVIQAINRIKMF